MPKDKQDTLTESDVLRALYHMYCAAAYKGNVTMSSETAIGLYNFFNSQKAEIESKNAIIDVAKSEIDRLVEVAYSGRPTTIEEMRAMQSYQKQKIGEIKRAKAEAIKEFAERLKNKLTSCSKTIDGKHEYLICDYDIDNLVKEMAGDV